MRSLLKYLLPFIFAAAFLCGNGESADVVSEDFFMEISIESTLSQTDISASDSDLCLPHQLSSANTLRLAGNARKTGNMHRSNIAFAKSRKVINAGVTYFTQNLFIITHSAMIRPSYRLITLGRLII